MAIPRVVLCSQARSGSSMMMRVLQAGGLIVDATPEKESSKTFFRNPYGLFENREGVLARNFVNSFKLLDPTIFPDVPSDYVVIRSNRSLSAILASWQSAYDTAVANNTCAITPAWLTDVTTRSTVNRARWDIIFSSLPNVLSLDYNTIVANPNVMAQSVAAVVNTSSFAFDVAAAAAAVDTALYINRG